MIRYFDFVIIYTFKKVGKIDNDHEFRTIVLESVRRLIYFIQPYSFFYRQILI